MSDETTSATQQELDACEAAWVKAHEAIMEAWKATPSYMLSTKVRLKRGLYSQTIASDAARHMIAACGAARTSVRVNQHARTKEYMYALETDEQAAAQGVELMQP